MNEEQIFNELKRLFTDNYLDKIKKSIIYKDDDGSVVLFGSYSIRKTNNGYLVEKYGNYLIELSSLQIAVTYCTFDKKNMVNQLLDIERLDRKLTDSNVNLEVHKRMSEKAKNLDDKALYLIKMNEDVVKKQRTKQYLNLYITQAKSYQQKIFESLA